MHGSAQKQRAQTEPEMQPVDERQAKAAYLHRVHHKPGLLGKVLRIVHNARHTDVALVVAHRV